MRFALSAATAVMAMATSVLAQTAGFDAISKPLKNEMVPAGANYVITWDPKNHADDTVSISLIGGATQGTQIPLMDIASGVANSAGSYSWPVDASLGAEKVYGLVIKLDSDPSIFQYSFPFQIKAASGSGSTGYGSGATTTITKPHGIKTVTLSSYSAPPSSTSTTETTETTSTSSTKSSTTMTTFKPTTVAATTTAPAVITTTSPAVATVTTNAAGRVGTGSAAVFGGLIMAYLAL